jgi:hypothetical protein
MALYPGIGQGLIEFGLTGDPLRHVFLLFWALNYYNIRMRGNYTIYILISGQVMTY